MNSATGKILSAKIKVLCEGRGVTIKKFEKDAGLSNGYWRKMSVYGSVPSADRLQMIADYFNVTTDYLVGDEPEKKGGTKAVKINLLGRVAAGIPIDAIENIIGEEEITKKMASKGDFFALLIKGDSMSPYIMDGDKVIVRCQEEAECGDIVVALIGGNDGVCKQLKKTPVGITLISKNPNYDPIVFTHSEIDTEPVRILGKVVEIRRSL